MTNPPKRDNLYWAGRLEKDGHGDLLARVNSGEITVYKATQLAGYRKKASKSVAGKLSYHWQRAGHAERKRFVTAHLKEVNRVVLKIRDDLVELKTEKAKQSAGK